MNEAEKLDNERLKKELKEANFLRKKCIVMLECREKRSDALEAQVAKYKAALIQAEKYIRASDTDGVYSASNTQKMIRETLKTEGES